MTNVGMGNPLSLIPSGLKLNPGSVPTPATRSLTWPGGVSGRGFPPLTVVES